MRKIGLIGGANWYATSLYFKRINEQIHRRVGGTCSAPVILESFNCKDINSDMSDEDWDDVAAMVIASAQRMEQAGATALVICANSMHKIHDRVAEAVNVPVKHITDTVAEKMKSDGIKSAALIGTRDVMAENWYRQRLVKHGIQLLPADPERVEEVDRIIRDELMFGTKSRDSERTLRTFITNIDKEEVDAVVLGCAELILIVDTKANVLPIYDSTEIHADAAVQWILGDTP